MKTPGRSVVISPHLDDAVLSTGPLMVDQVASGAEVVVLTVFSGGAVGDLTPAALEDRSRHGGADPMPMRWAEDLRALTLLGCMTHRADLPELIFRRRADGSPRCNSLADIYNPPDSDDDTVTESVRDWLRHELAELQADEVYIPLGVGQHVDHVIVRQAAESLAVPFNYYLDLPYVLRGAEVQLPADVDIVPWAFNDQARRAWLNGIACYESQLAILFEGSDWQSAFNEYAQSADAMFLRRS